MRNINSIIVHCTATEEGRDFRKADIDRWHRANGWDGCGYHFVIDLDGKIERGRSIEKVGAHCSGHNSNSIGVVYVGGLRKGAPADTRTEAQKQSMKLLVHVLMYVFNLNAENVHVHNEYSVKACPSFSRKQLISEIAL